MDNKGFCSDEDHSDQQQHNNHYHQNGRRNFHHHQQLSPPRSTSSSQVSSIRHHHHNNYGLTSPTPSIVHSSSSSTSTTTANNKDEAFEDLTSSSSTASTESAISEIQPININRNIFYTEDFYSKNSKNNFNLKIQKFNKTNNKNCFSSIIDSTRNLFKYLLPSNTQPSLIKSESILIKWLQTLFPILHWLLNYQWKKDFLNDLIAGCTILAMHIPQGLAYGRLAGVEPINGLYVSLFPVLIYALLGTGRQVSIGTFAVISIACKDALESFDLNEAIILNLDLTKNTTISSTAIPTPIPDLPDAIDILTTLALFVGLIQFLLGFFQLGIMSIILSETLISAFVTACSIHVFTSQIFALIDIESSGIENLEEPIPFDIIKSWLRFILRLPKTNLITLLISISSITILIVCKYILEPYLIKKFHLKKIIIPIDILVIVVTTLISAQLDLNGQYNVKIIPKIPKAFEGLPKIPQLSYFWRLYPSAILISFVSFVSTYSLGKMYSKKHGYEVSANQELIAIGAANFFSSFFLCYPCAGSLARSAVMDKVGAKTQLASIVSSILMILFLLFFSGYLHTLPKAVLSCIIVVALWSTLKQIKQVKKAWYSCKLDGVLWIGTFLFVVLFGVGHGLLYSVLFSFVILILKLIIPIIKLKRQVKNSEVFIEIDHLYDYNYNPKTDEQNDNHNNPNNNWVVFEFQGPLIFINTIIFKQKFYELIGKYLIKQINNDTSMGKKKTDSTTTIMITMANQKQQPKQQLKQSSNFIINLIIFDCTRLTYIDSKGVEILLETLEQIKQYNIKMVLASCSKLVFNCLEKNDFFKKFNIRNCYMSVMDAIADIDNNS